MMEFELLGPWSDIDAVRRDGGGKATHLRLLELAGHPVPPWVCVPAPVFDRFLESCALPVAAYVAGGDEAFARDVETRFLACELPAGLSEGIRSALYRLAIADIDVAVRSSGLGEDSAEQSFAGQFDSFLYRRGEEQVLEALRRCWASAYSARN